MNNRAWPRGYKIGDDPGIIPTIAEDIDIHLIDLVSMKRVGEPFRGHKAYTPEEDWFYISLDVTADYIGRLVIYILEYWSRCISWGPLAV